MQGRTQPGWDREAEKRPNFPEIIFWCECVHFAILPDANGVKIAEFSGAILEWEQQKEVKSGQIIINIRLHIAG
jgi:hypothetical protein